MDEHPFLSEQHPVSHRWAIVEDDGRVAWLYLTAPESAKPVSDCWLYNCVPAPAECDLNAMRGGDAPIVPQAVAGPGAVMSPDQDALWLRWSADGESVAVFARDQLLGFIAAGRRRGFSKHLTASGAFGSVLDPNLFTSVFEPSKV